MPDHTPQLARWTLTAVPALVIGACFVVSACSNAPTATSGCAYDDDASAGIQGTLTKTQGDAQTVASGGQVALEILLEDVVSERLCNATIDWAPAPGNGSVSSAQNMTDGSGLASTTWTVGATAGTQTLTVTVENSVPTLSGTFTATVTGLSGCTAGTAHGGTITADETWLKADNPHVVSVSISVANDATLTLEPGVVVCFAPGASINPVGPGPIRSGRIVAIGTVNDSIRFTGTSPQPPCFPPVQCWDGINLVGAPSNPSMFDYVVLEDALYGVNVLSVNHPVTIDHSVIRNITIQAVNLRAGGSSFVNSTVDGTTASGDFGAVRLAGGPMTFSARVLNATGVGVFVTADLVTLQNCEVTGSTSHGVVFDFGITAGSITGCNLFNNGGNGVQNNEASVVINAQGNWWGDVSGPTGPGGDGVSADVDGSNFLTSPVSLGYAPPALATGLRRVVLHIAPQRQR